MINLFKSARRSWRTVAVPVAALALLLSVPAAFAATTFGTNITTGGTLTVSGNTTLGDAATDTVTFYGKALTGPSNVVSQDLAAGGSMMKFQYKAITTALTGDFEGMHVRASTDVGSAANSVNGGQFKAVANDVASQLTVSALRGVYTSVDAKDNLVTTARAFEASLDGMAGSTITEAVGIELMNNSSGTQTASYGLSVNGGTASGHKVYTRDIRLQNGEFIDNATDGTVLVTAPTTSLSGDLTVTGNDVTFGNAETISNATNGTVAVGGNLSVTGARISNISGEEKFLSVSGNLTGTGDGSTNAKTWVIQASATRLAGANTVNGDMDEAILKGSITNKATANEANYIMRGLNIAATNRDGGNVNKLHGGLISATQKADSPIVTDLWGLGLKVEQDSGNATVPTNIYGLNVEYDVVMASPTNSAGVRVYDNSDTGLTKPLAGFQTSYNSGLASKWQYGLVIDTGSVSTADVKLSGAGSVTPLIMSGAGEPSAGACTANTLGSIYLRTDGSTSTTLYVCTAASTWTAK